MLTSKPSKNSSAVYPIRDLLPYMYCSLSVVKGLVFPFFLIFNFAPQALDRYRRGISRSHNGSLFFLNSCRHSCRLCSLFRKRIGCHWLYTQMWRTIEYHMRNSERVQSEVPMFSLCNTKGILFHVTYTKRLMCRCAIIDVWMSKVPKCGPERPVLCLYFDVVDSKMPKIVVIKTRSCRIEASIVGRWTHRGCEG